MFIKDYNPVGIVSVGKEPIQLLEPLGTPLSIIRVVDLESAEGILREFVSQALSISKEHDVEYAFTSLPAEYADPAN